MSNLVVDQEFEALLDYVKRSRGFDFTGYKRSTLVRRVDKRMKAIDIETSGDYMDYLEVHPEEFIQLFNTTLINVTDFFRDPPMWDYVAAEILPRILKEETSQSIRIWSTGCASGQEAYTVAMLLGEILGEEQLRERVKIYATDVDEDALHQARQASYTAKEINAVPQALLDKYFERSEERYVFRTDLRRAVIFGRHDLVQDAPISRIDLLVCRNTLIYFNAETQTRILGHFRFALEEGGFLFLGKSEMLLTHVDAFTPVDLSKRVFIRARKVRLRDDLPMTQAGDGEARGPSAREVARDAAFESARVGQVMVDRKGLLVAANHEARALFGLSPADLSRPLQDLEISHYEPLRELRSQIERAYAERSSVTLGEIEWPTAAGEPRILNVEVTPMMAAGGDVLGVTVTFTDVTQYSGIRTQLELSKRELETAYEELQSSNEELETTNEELQSSNEELETINEELQSTNEEMRAINAQLREREREVGEASAFSDSILAGLRAGVIVVDRDLLVQVWTSRAEDLWGLRADEVKGQNFLSLEMGLPVERLRQCLRVCLAGEADYQEVALDATTRRAKAIQCRVICTPLVGPATEIRGVILITEERGDAESSRGRKRLAEMGEDLAPRSRRSPAR